MCGCVHRCVYIPPCDTALQGISVTELGSHDDYNTLLFHCCPNNTLADTEPFHSGSIGEDRYLRIRRGCAWVVLLSSVSTTLLKSLADDLERKGNHSISTGFNFN